MTTLIIHQHMHTYCGADKLGHLREVSVEIAVAVLVECVIWARAGNVRNFGAQFGVLELPIPAVDLINDCKNLDVNYG